MPAKRRPPAPRSVNRRPGEAKRTAKAVPAQVAEPREFRLGVVPGATPGKWIDIWKERMPRHPFTLVPLTVHEQYAALVAREVDAAIARLPLSDDALHQIALYEELAVVVANRDSHLLAADELTIADLEGETLLQIDDGVFEGELRALRRSHRLRPALSEQRQSTHEGPELELASDAIATVGAGVGIAIVPMSIARANQRKDVEYRVLTDGPTSQVVLAWPKDDPHPEIDMLIGIVRGRTANSSRA